jgi:hypothetical protein
MNGGVIAFYGRPPFPAYDLTSDWGCKYIGHEKNNVRGVALILTAKTPRSRKLLAEGKIAVWRSHGLSSAQINVLMNTQVDFKEEPIPILGRVLSHAPTLEALRNHPLSHSHNNGMGRRDWEETYKVGEVAVVLSGLKVPRGIALARMVAALDGRSAQGGSNGLAGHC